MQDLACAEHAWEKSLCGLCGGHTLPAVISRLKERLQSPGFSIALALVAVGGLGVYLGRHDKLREWAPNIAVTAFALAITITVVEWILRREARARLRPRVERVGQSIEVAFESFISGVCIDYAATHGARYYEIPDNAIDMLNLWLTEQDMEDRPRELQGNERLPMLADAAMECINELEESRARDLDVLEPEFVRAIDDFRQSVRQGVGWCRLRPGLGEAFKGAPAAGLKSIVDGARRFATVLVLDRSHAKWMTIDPLTKDIAREHRELRSARLGPTDRPDL